MPLIQTYQSGETNRRAEVHKDINTGDYSVKHFEGGSAVRQIPVPGGQDPHMIAKNYVSETLVQTYQSGETNRRSEVHKEPNTGDYSVKHYKHGSLVKHLPVKGDQDPHKIAKRYISEQTCPVCGNTTKVRGVQCAACKGLKEDLKQAQAHKEKIDYNDPSTHRHADAATEHLLAAELKKRGDNENSAKASERAKRFSKALKEDVPPHLQDDTRHYRNGLIAGHKGKQASENPHHPTTQAHVDWNTGHEEGMSVFQRRKKLREDAVGGAPTNNVGSGAVAGLGVGKQGEPGVTKKKSPVVAKMIRRKQVSEHLNKDAKAGDYVDDFVHSKNSKFSGDSKKERIKRALGAYYGKKRKG